jgi:hypothetical protein
MTIRKSRLMLALLPMMAACASAPAPTDRMANAESAVRAAKEVGSDQVPKAQLLVKLAQEEIDKAKKLSADGENEKAASLLARASADAELGLAMAREQAARDSAQKTVPEAQNNAAGTPTPTSASSL